jgi:hypothetical protein
MLNSRDKLYQALSDKYDLGTKEEFNSKMNSPESRKKLYSAVSSDFDLGSYEEFESKVSPVKKKDGTKPQSESTTKAEKSVSAPTSGSSDLLGTQKFGKDLIVESNRQIAQKEKAKQQPAKEQPSFDEQIKQPNPFEREYKDVSGQIKKAPKTAIVSKNTEVANQAYDYAIKNVDKQKSEERLADELNAYQLTDGIKDGLKGVFNKFIATPLNQLNYELGGNKDFRIKDYKPLQDELQVARRELEQEYGPKAQITQQQIQKKAEELFIKKDQQEQMQQLIDEALPRGYDREGIWKELKLDQLRSNDKLRSAVASVEVFNTQIKEFDSFAKSLSNKAPSPQEIEKFNALREKAVTAVEGLEFIGNNFENYLKDAKTDAEKLELFKYNYNDFEKNPTLLWNTAKNIVAGTTKLLAETSIYANRARGDFYNPIAQSLSEMSSEEINENEADSAQFYRYKASNINSWSDLGSLTTQLASEQIPVLASIYMGGNVGTGVVSASSGGQKINELEEQAKQPFGKIYSQGEKLLAGYLYAGAEFFPEKFGTARILKDLERTVSSASSASRKLFTDGLMKSTFSGIKNATKNVFLEGGTEYLTAEGQIAIDKELLDIVESDYQKNQKRSESFFAGALIGGAMSAVGGAVGFGVSQSKLYSDRKDIKRVKEILANVDVINSEIENNKTLTDAEKKELYSKMNEMNNEAFAIVEKNAMKGTNLSIQEKSFLLDVNQKQNELISKAEEVKKSNFSKEIKQGMLNDLKTQFESLEQNRMKTLEGKDKPSMESKPSTKTKETNAETKSPTPESEVKSETEVQEQTEVEEEVVDKTGVYEYQGETFTINESGITSRNENGEEVMYPVDKIEEVVSNGKKISELKANEATPATNTPTDGNIRPTTEQVGEMATEQKSTTEVAETEVVESAVEPKSSEGVAEPLKGNENVKFYTGRKNKIEDFSKTKGEFIFFSKNKDVSKWYGGEETNVTEANLDTSNFIDLTSQEKKANFVRENFSDDDIKELYKKEIKFSKGRDVFNKVSDEDLINEYRKKAEEDRFSADGKNQNFLLRKIKEKGFDGVALIDSFFGKNDISYVVLNKDSINRKQPTRKEIRKKAVEVKIDEIANSVKNLESVFGIKIKAQGDDINIQGTSREQLIDFIAKTAKEIAKTGIEIDEAIRTVIDEIKKSFDTDIEVDEVRGLVEEKPEPKKEKDFKGQENSFEYNASFIPNSGEVSEYLSGETIEKYTGEKPTDDQAIKTVKLVDALKHGINTIELAKEQFGDEYVSKILEFAENSNIPVEARALLYVSLENDLNKQIKENPENKADLKKKLNLVYQKSQAFARSTSLAQNMRRLQAFAKVGFDENSITDQMFSPQQLEDKAKIERAVASNMDEINDEEANQEFGEEYDFLVAEPKRKRDSSVIKSEINDTIKKMRADLLRVAKGGNLNVTIPYADQIRVATPHIIKLSKLFAEDGVLKAKALVEAVYSEIKQVFPSLSKNDVAKIIKNENQPQTEKQKKNSKAAKVLKDLLIEAGYSRQATIKGEKRTLFDWKKLAGEEGSVENMRSRAEKVLKSKGYSESQIKEMQDALQEEYTNLRASIIEKSLKDLQSRNRIRPEVNIKSPAKRLAELYDRGLFEEDMSEYANLLNSALGFNEFDKATYKHLEELAKALSVIYGYDSSVTGEKLTEQSVNTIKNKVNQIVKQILIISALKQGNKKFKVASMLQEFVGLGMRSKLMSLSQMIQNPFSGFTERAFQRMGDFFDVKENGEIKANRKKLGKYIARDIRLKGGSFYGDVSMALVSTSKFETWLNSKSDNELYHLMLTSLTGRAYLEAADSANKAKLTEGLFVKNIISLLTSKSNPNGAMTKKEAMNFVAEQLGGQNLENARTEAKKLIEKINKEVGREVIKPNTETIERMATDMVKEHLLTGQKISADMVEKSFRAAYKVAGYSIGHEANNVISKHVSIGNSMVEKELEKAVKDKKWDEATAMISLSILTKNILNPFLGGKTNWVVLQLQKTALDPFSMLYTWYKKKDNKLDLSTDEGIKNLEKALIYQQKLRTETVRYFVGASIALGMFLAAKATGADDDIDKWLKKNEWARKYFKLISPPALQLMISAKNKEMSKDISDMTGMSTDAFNDELKAIKSLDKEDDSTSGRIGKIIGAPADAPVPWRVVRDIDNVYRGIVGLPQVKSDYKVTGFWNGMMQGGLFDYMRMRPGVNYDMQEEINKVKEETDRYNQKVDDLSREINDDKLSEKQIQQRLIELFKDSPEKIKKTVDLLQDRKKEDLIREKVDSDFYIKLKREKNPSIKAVMIYYQFGDITKLSPEELSKIDKNMQMIGFDWNDEAVKKYGELINSKQKK